ncbi:hypothetical protein SF123566_8072 [Shigella flexneri 1235-66]|nr:hypothetical protein SF123566_8072 [Shigella flexneri 1235-66]
MRRSSSWHISKTIDDGVRDIRSGAFTQFFPDLIFQGFSSLFRRFVSLVTTEELFSTTTLSDADSWGKVDFSLYFQ